MPLPASPIPPKRLAEDVIVSDEVDEVVIVAVEVFCSTAAMARMVLEAEMAGEVEDEVEGDVDIEAREVVEIEAKEVVEIEDREVVEAKPVKVVEPSALALQGTGSTMLLSSRSSPLPPAAKPRPMPKRRKRSMEATQQTMKRTRVRRTCTFSCSHTRRSSSSPIARISASSVRASVTIARVCASSARASAVIARASASSARTSAVKACASASSTHASAAIALASSAFAHAFKSGVASASVWKPESAVSTQTGAGGHSSVWQKLEELGCRH
mmetsp:Transcript_32223/g.68553  ORF Transcript_32223/g.68553 Transcript_32223/m.68553 type:complete len:271 (+) Transcript_32223:956-1768(+)